MENIVLNTYERILRRLRYEIKPQRYDSKIFCIGFNKTGTTSFGDAMNMLGYDHSSFNTKLWRVAYCKDHNLWQILRYTSKFESFDDLPWLKEDMIPILDQFFPGSKFVYLYRDETSWAKSMKNWTYLKTGELPDMDLKLDEYRKHKEFIDFYFKDSSDDKFLRLDVKDPEAFFQLAKFLGKEHLVGSQKSMPHSNKTRHDIVPGAQ